MNDWHKTKDGLPKYGLPVLLIWQGVIQDTVYYRDIGEFIDVHNDYDPMPEDEPSHWMYFSSIEAPSQ
jgi:hypothetical protein